MQQFTTSQGKNVKVFYHVTIIGQVSDNANAAVPRASPQNLIFPAISKM